MRYALVAALAFSLGVSTSLIAKSELTDVRVGPTAAIGITTSADGTVVYIAHGNGVFRSQDSGKSWVKVH